MIDQKICKKCNQMKPNIKFSVGRNSCKECISKYKHLRYKATTILKNSGNKYGKLTVISFVAVKESNTQSKTRASIFKCKCDCGNIGEYIGSQLKSGVVKSCGCLIHDNIKKRNSKWTGTGGLSGTSWNRIVRNSINNRRAKRRNLLFTITKKEVWDLFLTQKGKCALSGIDLILDIGSRIKLQTASLDRIDSAKGYTIDNVQWVHKDVNCMKMAFDEKYLIEMCRKIVSTFDAKYN